MARTRKKAAKPTQASADAMPETIPVTEPAGEAATGIAAEAPQAPAKDAAAREPTYAADPHPKISVSLSDHQAARACTCSAATASSRCRYASTASSPTRNTWPCSRQAGWTDRSESEGVWTKQIDPNARWQSVQKMEREFRDVANAIRRDKGMGPVLEGLAVA